MKLLYDLCQTIEEAKQTGKGRPKLSMKDMVFSSALKIFTTFSLRRFMTDMKQAKDMGYTKRISHFSMVSYYMEKEELTPILQELIANSAMPLRSVETKFAIDSTGFRTTLFNDYCREKHDMFKEHQWIKAHICAGVKTNIVTGVEITGEEGGDNPRFIPLAERTFDNGFDIEEISADKAYSARVNFEAVEQMGGTAYIPFKNNATGRSKGSFMWKKMFRYFVYNRDEFLRHYHLRSNIESTNNMIKAKFTDIVRSRNKTAQINEVLLKVLCHNICVLIQEMFELGIEPNFLGG
jgi:transposase